jgi:hypothetical protein
MSKFVSKIFTLDNVDKSHASIFRSNNNFHIFTRYVVYTIHFSHVSCVLLNTLKVVTSTLTFHVHASKRLKVHIYKKNYKYKKFQIEGLVPLENPVRVHPFPRFPACCSSAIWPTPAHGHEGLETWVAGRSCLLVDWPGHCLCIVRSLSCLVNRTCQAPWSMQRKYIQKFHCKLCIRQGKYILI